MTEDPKLWWSAAEIAEAGLPDMPTTKAGVQKLAERLRWQSHPTFSRRRSGRGGGWEYHRALFPEAARLRLVSQDPTPTRPDDAVDRPERAEAWARFEALPDKPKAEAARRLNIIQQVEALELAMIKNTAVYTAGIKNKVAPRTIWNWLYMIEGVAPEDRLAYLAPRHRFVRRKPTAIECDPEFLDYLKSDYLRPEAPSFTSCYRRAMRVAEANGWASLTEPTARRRLDAEVSEAAQIYARKGLEALKRLYPAQRRDRRALAPLEAVNADYHKWDVFVQWPGHDLPVRPQMCAFQDIFSGRILSWRIDRTPNKWGVALALGDMIDRFGIPEHVLLDNGTEFANKFLTGQVPNRNRYQVRDDDITGLLVAMGCEVHWATPYSGQSKPIERAFRDLCDSVAKDPRFAGAYTGNRPDAKPENYGARAISLDDFLAVIAEGIEEHNARPGRRSDACRGRSFIETFDTAYATAPIRKATPEQTRMWMMGAEGLRAHSRTGEISYQGNGYWSDWMHTIAGRKVTARFDPANLWEGLHLYGLDGSYLGHAACRERKGFFDIEEGRAHAKARTSWMNAEKAAAKAARKLRAAELGQALDDTTPEPRKVPEAKVVKLPKVRQVGSKRPAQLPKVDAAADAAHAKFVEHATKTASDFGAHRAKRLASSTQDDSLTRYRDALELRARIEAGERISSERRRWLDGYETTPEFRALKQMHEAHGEQFLG